MINLYDEHKRLFTDTGLKLGKSLWYLLTASQEMQRKKFIEKLDHQGLGMPWKLTEFGKEVGKDEIYWWVYKKENDIDELNCRVKKALISLQILKDSANILDSSDIKTYAKLITTLGSFTEVHKNQINALFEFVKWLYAKDPLVPVLLFTYRVWGSTARADRTIEVGTNLENEPAEKIKRITEIAYGLFHTTMYVLDTSAWT